MVCTIQIDRLKSDHIGIEIVVRPLFCLGSSILKSDHIGIEI